MGGGVAYNGLFAEQESTLVLVLDLLFWFWSEFLENLFCLL